MTARPESCREAAGTLAGFAVYAANGHLFWLNLAIALSVAGTGTAVLAAVAAAVWLLLYLMVVTVILLRWLTVPMTPATLGPPYRIRREHQGPARGGTGDRRRQPRPGVDSGAVRRHPGHRRGDGPAPAVGLIATRSTGTDHIDTAEVARRGITIANVPDYGSVAVAEHTFQDQDLRILGAIGTGEQG